MKKRNEPQSLDDVDAHRPKSRRGFASMTPEERKRIASLGGKAVPPTRRGFYRDRKLASQSGAVGGAANRGVVRGPRPAGAAPIGTALLSPEQRVEQARLGGLGVPAEKRSFARDASLARSAGIKGAAMRGMGGTPIPRIRFIDGDRAGRTGVLLGRSGVSEVLVRLDVRSGAGPVVRVRERDLVVMCSEGL